MSLVVVMLRCCAPSPLAWTALEPLVRSSETPAAKQQSKTRSLLIFIVMDSGWQG
jgi:hypothetical protein